jgi:hypothetical protein
MLNWTNDEVQKVISEISKKSSVDSDFRKLTLENPAQAIKQITGKDIPDGFKIKIIENEPDVDFTLILPDFQKEELSESELSGVSGGRGNPQLVSPY